MQSKVKSKVKSNVQEATVEAVYAASPNAAKLAWQQSTSPPHGASVRESHASRAQLQLHTMSDAAVFLSRVRGTGDPRWLLHLSCA